MKIAIIPARGGSKRIPRKNIKLFRGKPIIAYSIEAAILSNLFDEIMVSTDDQEIAQIAEQYGATIPFFRSSKNSNDTATTIDVITEVIDWYTDKGKTIDEICCIYPCAPFVTIELLQQGYMKLITLNVDTVFPVVKYSSPIQRALKIRGDVIQMFNPEYINTRSQDLEDAYFDAGMFYWSRKSNVTEKKKLYTNNSSFIEVSELHSQDIDNENDWKLAELKYELLHLSK